MRQRRGSNRLIKQTKRYLLKFSFSDKIEPKYINLNASFDCEINGVCFCNWELILAIESSGIMGYKYFLRELTIPIYSLQNNKKVSSEIQIAYNEPKKKYFLKMYDNSDTASFYDDKVEVYYKEIPFNSEVKRSQIFIKKIDINLTKQSKKLIITL